jgi:hypothetical protein
VLRYAELRCVQNLPREASAVTPAAKFFDELFEDASMLPNCQTFDVLEDKVRGFELRHNPDEFANKTVPGIVQRPMAD